MRFNEKTALVTGGARGIGATTALLFAREGARAMAFAFSLARIHPIESTAQLYDFIVFFEKRICLRFIA